MPLPQVTIQGNVCLEPQLQITEAGKARLTLRIAAGERRKDDNGNWVDGDTTFINCTLWGHQAESAAETIAKGSPVIILGKLKSRTVETDDKKTVYFEVAVDHLALDVKKAAKVESTDQWAVTSPF